MREKEVYIMRPNYQPTQTFLNILAKYPNVYQFCMHYSLNPITIDNWLGGISKLSTANRSYIALRMRIRENQVAV